MKLWKRLSGKGRALSSPASGSSAPAPGSQGDDDTPGKVEDASNSNSNNSTSASSSFAALPGLNSGSNSVAVVPADVNNRTSASSAESNDTVKHDELKSHKSQSSDTADSFAVLTKPRSTTSPTPSKKSEGERNTPDLRQKMKVFAHWDVFLNCLYYSTPKKTFPKPPPRVGSSLSADSRNARSVKASSGVPLQHHRSSESSPLAGVRKVVSDPSSSHTASPAAALDIAISTKSERMLERQPSAAKLAAQGVLQSLRPATSEQHQLTLNRTSDQGRNTDQPGNRKSLPAAMDTGMASATTATEVIGGVGRIDESQLVLNEELQSSSPRVTLSRSSPSRIQRATSASLGSVSAYQQGQDEILADDTDSCSSTQSDTLGEDESVSMADKDPSLPASQSVLLQNKADEFTESSSGSYTFFESDSDLEAFRRIQTTRREESQKHTTLDSLQTQATVAAKKDALGTSPQSGKRRAKKRKFTAEELDKLLVKGNPKDVYGQFREIGKGAYGRVYIATAKKAGSDSKRKQFAIKHMKRDFDLSSANNKSKEKAKEEREREDSISSIANEIALLDSCHHVNIVNYVASYLWQKKIWIVMEYCDAGTLKQLLAIEMSEGQIANVLHQVLSGLHYLHSHHRIHRDIKSSNILLNMNGEVKIADLGLSVDVDVQGEGSSESEGTVSGMAGSKYWMAPEMITRQPYGSKVDIWSTGALTVEMAEGNPPNGAFKPLKALFLTATQGAPPLKRPERWSSTFRSFLAGCFERNPAKRPSAEQLLQHALMKKACENKELVKALKLVFLMRVTAGL